MKNIIKILALALFVLGASIARAHDKSVAINDAQKAFLSQYETLRAALAADDLSAAKKAAETIASNAPAATLAKEGETQHAAAYIDAAKKLASADSLDAARDAFKVISKRAVHLASSQKGYYHAHCPMVPNEEGNWVQTTKKISNPYLGKKMPTCGSIED